MSLIQDSLVIKAIKNKCLGSHLCLHLFQGFKIYYQCSISMARMMRISAFSKFLKHLSRPIRNVLKITSKVVLIITNRQFAAN